MKVSIAVNQKVGMPNYGSAGASCEITLDLAEHTVSEHPEALVTEIRRAYALAQDAVAEQLAHQTAAAPEPAQKHEPEPPRREPDYDRRPSQARQPSEREPDRPRRNAPDGRPYQFPPKSDGPPNDGRQLFPWAKKQEEAGCQGLIKAIEDMGAQYGYPRKFADYNHEETRAAVALWRELTGQQPPPRNGNGYAHSNNNGYSNGRN